MKKETRAFLIAYYTKKAKERLDYSDEDARSLAVSIVKLFDIALKRLAH